MKPTSPYSVNTMPGSLVKLIRANGAGSLSLEFIQDCAAYKAGDRINLMPYEVTEIKASSTWLVQVPRSK